MPSLQIKTGQVNLTILDDFGNERGTFSFNPNDVAVAKKFTVMQQELIEKEKDYNERVKNCETPIEQVNLLNEIVDYFEKIIDDCFGEGSSELLFGGAKTLSMFEDFFVGITPYYEKASKERMQKYAVKK